MIPIIRVDNNTGNTITIENDFQPIISTYLSGDLIAATTTLRVINGLSFSTANPYIVIGNIGSDTAELRNVSSSTAMTIVVTSSISFAHAQGEPVNNVPYNQVVIESSPTINGTYTTLATISIDWTSKSTVYQHPAGLASTYYRARFLNQGATIYSAYSEAASAGSFDFNTAGYLISRAREQMGDTSDVSDSFLVGALNDARNIINTNFAYGQLNDWRHKFEHPIRLLAGTNYVNLPANIDFNKTNRTLLNARYARNTVAATLPLRYVDKREWNSWAYQNRFSFTLGSTSIGASTLVLSNSGDFASSGTVFIATDSPTQTIMAVTFTGNNLATNTLTGCSGITRVIPDNTQVWGYSTFSFPFFYTVFDEKIWFERPIPNSLQGKNLYIDYYTALENINTLTDTIPEHYRNVYIDYLKFAIKKRRDNSIGEDDEDYKRFMRSINNVMDNPYIGQHQIIIT